MSSSKTGLREAGGRAFRCSLLAAYCSLLLTGCSGAQSALDAAGPQAGNIGLHLKEMVYVLTAVFVIVMCVLAVAALRGRVARGGPASVAPDIKDDPDRQHRMTRNVSVAVGITILILFALLASSFITGRSLYTTVAAKPDTLTIEITGHQWWWEIRYDDPTPSRMVTTANEIHIPVGRPVLFRLTSTDVIHSFWVPNLHGKTDLIPGHITTTLIRADRAGTYRGQCAEYCGHQHAHMAFTVVVEPPDKFQQWYEAQLQPAPQPSTPSQAHGQQVFLTSPCVLCHKIQGTDAGGMVGPDLTHIGSRPTIAAGTLENTRGHLAGWVVNSQEIKPGNRMPPNNIQPDDLQALLDYLQSLK